MKSELDIHLTSIHLGQYHRVVTLGINGQDPARDFLSKLSKNDSRKWKQVTTRIAAIADYLSYENQQTFRYLGNGIYEFKRPGIRLYAFYDTIDKDHHLILCVNGGTKNKRKEQAQDISRAKLTKERYFAAKTNPTTIFTLEIEDET